MNDRHPKFQNVETKLEKTKLSRKGQIPFVELNGKEIPDSNFIIRELAQIFHKDHLETNKEDEEAAIHRAMAALIEDSLYWSRI